MRYGRLDASSEEDCTPPGSLPAAAAPFPREASPAQHLRDTFYRMGFDDRDIVALRSVKVNGVVTFLCDRPMASTPIVLLINSDFFLCCVVSQRCTHYGSSSQEAQWPGRGGTPMCFLLFALSHPVFIYFLQLTLFLFRELSTQLALRSVPEAPYFLRALEHMALR